MKRLLVGLAVLATVTLSAQPLRVVGSDLLQAYLTGVQQGGGPELALDLKGTQPGLAVFGAGNADVLVALDTGETRPEVQGLARYQVGSVAAVVVVHGDNPIREMTLEQVRLILASAEAGGASRWGELGLESAGWGTRTITVRAVAPRLSLSLEFARASSGLDGRMKPTIVLVDDPAAVYAALAEDRSGVGIVPLPPPEGSPVRAVPLSSARGETAFGPSIDNVFNRDYRLAMPVRVYAKREDAARLAPLLRAIYGEAGTSALLASGFVPIPARERQAILAELE